MLPLICEILIADYETKWQKKLAFGKKSIYKCKNLSIEFLSQKIYTYSFNYENVKLSLKMHDAP